MVSDPSGEAVPAAVTMTEWAIEPEVESAPAGEITFTVANEGAVVHEFVVIRTDLPPGELPVSVDKATRLPPAPPSA